MGKSSNQLFCIERLALLIVGSLLLAGLCQEACAQSRFSLYASGNLGEARAPHGIYEDVFKLGKGAGAALGLRLHRFVEVALGVRYSHFDFKSDSLTTTIKADNPQGYKTVRAPVSGGDLSVVGITFDVKARSPYWRRIGPYLVAGLGVYRTENEPIETGAPINFTSAGGSRRAVGANMGAGLEVRLSKEIRSFVEGRYLWNLSSDDRSYLTGRAGIALSL